MNPGFNFAERFGRGRGTGRRVDDHPDGGDRKVVLYCPFRCPECGERYPDHRGTGRGRLPVHYLRCKGCGTRYDAQEVDELELLRIASDRLRDGG